MPFPNRLVVHQCAGCADGGTVIVWAIDETGARHTVILVQHAFVASGPPESIPGRLYFDGAMVPMRSELEGQLMALLRTAEVRLLERPGAGQPGGGLSPAKQRAWVHRHLHNIVTFVESQEYLTFAALVEGSAAEPSDPASRPRE